MDIGVLTSKIEPLLGRFDMVERYGSWLWIGGGLLALGVIAPLLGAIARFAVSLGIQTIRAPLRWARGISNELAYVIHRHGPGFTRVIARPLAVAILIGAGYAVSTQLGFKSKPPTSPPQQPKIELNCSGDVVPLSCPPRR
jgi:hypothetical protein